MSCGFSHAVVTFLRDKGSLRGVDPEFRSLVRLFHRIPYCATFGVSCAGHGPGPVRYHGEELGRPNYFWPQLSGSLRIIIARDISHIEELKFLIEEVVTKYQEASFKKIQHLFGPSAEVTEVEVWEIRITKKPDSIPDEGWYGTLKVSDYPDFFRDSSKAGREIKKFWKNLEREIMLFADRHGFGGFELDKRVNEIMSIWKPKKPPKAITKERQRNWL